MQTVSEQHSEAHRRPTGLDLAAAGLLAATVVLHVVAMFFTYWAGEQPITGQADQVALYAIVAGSWALALGIGLTGPHRTPVAAALAVGVALGEVGFRIADLGVALHYGTSTVGAGLWIMDAAWVVGAVAALVAVLAALSRHRPPAPAPVPAPGLGLGADPDPTLVDPTLVADPAGVQPQPAGVQPQPGAVPDPTVVGAPTTVGATVPVDLPAAGDPLAPTGPPTDVLPATGYPVRDQWAAHERLVWTILVVLLAILSAAAFLPAWDHELAYSGQSGDVFFSHNEGNAFSGPWGQVLGNSIVAAMILVVPIVAVRLKNKAVGAALVVGVLLELASQLTSAVVQATESLDPTQFGFSAGQVSQYDVIVVLKLTGWFTVDALAAYGLFAAVMVWANLRTVADDPLAPWASGPAGPLMSGPLPPAPAPAPAPGPWPAGPVAAGPVAAGPVATVPAPAPAPAPGLADPAPPPTGDPVAWRP